MTSSDFPDDVIKIGIFEGFIGELKSDKIGEIAVI